MKAHFGVDAGTGYVDSVTATAASVQDLDQIAHLVWAEDPHLSQVEFRIAARKSKLAAMAGPDRVAESRKASVRAKVEHPFLIVKRDFGFNWVMRARALARMG